MRLVKLYLTRAGVANFSKMHHGESIIRHFTTKYTSILILFHSEDGHFTT